MKLDESIVIAAAPDDVWRVGGDAGAVADWIPAIEASHLEGDLRHVTFAGGGGDAVERIVERDDGARSYVYEYVSGPLALESYRSRFTVGDHAEGSQVVWTAEFSAADPQVEADLHQGIGDIYRGALAELKRQLERR